MRPPRLRHVVELFSLRDQRLGEAPQARQQLLSDRYDGRHVRSGGDHVIGRLSQIDVVVRVHGIFRANLASKELNGAVRDDLVGVHVGGSARAGLEDVEHEVLVQRAVHHLGGRPLDRFRALRIQEAELRVHLGSRLLDRSERLNEPTPETNAADGEVPSSPLGLSAIQHPGRYAHLAHRILLDPLHGCGLDRGRVLRLRSHR